MTIFISSLLMLFNCDSVYSIAIFVCHLNYIYYIVRELFRLITTDIKFVKMPITVRLSELL